METIILRVKKIIQERLEVPAEQLTEETHFTRDLQVDSLDALDLLLAMNEEFHTHIPPEALENIHTIGDMVSVIQQDLRE